MKVAGEWLDREATRQVFALLAQGGHRALAVGGCVRNALLRMPVADVDIATDATPERVMQLADAAGVRAVATGVDHGTVTLVVAGHPYEVTTFRRDMRTDGRRAVVAFSQSLAEDAARRDFTMNALYCEADGALVDPLSGLADALARRVRFVGRPEDRIREDYLRILRFFRFTAWYADPAAGPDPEGLAACAALAEGLDVLSHERLGAETKKLLAAPNPAPAVAAMAAGGILARLLPGADHRALAVLVHVEDGRAPSALRRLAVLGGDDPAGRLRLSKAEARVLQDVTEAARADEGPAALGWGLGADVAADAVLCRAALRAETLPADWRAEVARGAAARFPVTAADLMPGLAGPALGARLEALKRRWLDSGLHLTRDQLLAATPG